MDMGARVKVVFPESEYRYEGQMVHISFPKLIIEDEEFKLASIQNFGDDMVEISFMVKGSELEIIREEVNE